MKSIRHLPRIEGTGNRLEREARAPIPCLYDARGLRSRFVRRNGWPDRLAKAAAQQPPKPQSAPVAVRFTDIRKTAGITFVQDSTETDEKYYLETMGTGVAWIDYDQDGLMDLYFVQSAATDVYKPVTTALCPLSQQR